MINIRPANIADAPAIRALVIDLAHYYHPDHEKELPVWLQTSLSLSAFTDRLGDSDYATFVAMDGDMVAAYIAIWAKKHLYHLFVADNYQRQGLASQLWHHAIAQQPADCYTVRSSLYAVPVYERFGFVKTGDLLSKDGLCFQPMTLEHQHNGFDSGTENR